MEKPAAACKDQDNSKQQQQQQQQPQQQRVVWDCGSSLYDSFELKSFKRQLESAIVSSRTNSMPRLSNRAPLISQTTEKKSAAPVSTTKKSKISRSLQKFLRSVFRPKHADSSTIFHVEEKYSSNKDSHGFYNVNVQPFGEILSTIPEIDLEMDKLKSYVDIDHPQSEYYDDSAVVRKTVSERFTKRSMIGITCV